VFFVIQELQKVAISKALKKEGLKLFSNKKEGVIENYHSFKLENFCSIRFGFC